MRRHNDTGPSGGFRRRNGITSVMAMMFLVLIGALALGFYAQVNTAGRLSNNDQKGARALVAAESGVRFMRFKLARVDIPPNTPTNQLLVELQKDLQTTLEQSGNLAEGTVTLANNEISIQGAAGGMISVDGPTQSGFSARIALVGGGSDGVICKITGYSGSGNVRATKHAQLRFRRETYQGLILNNAAATRGRLTMSKGLLGGVPGLSADSIASVASASGATPSVVVSGGSIGGDIGVMDYGLASINGGSVGGTKDLAAITRDHVKVVTPPAFPYVDTTIFEPFATGMYNSTATVLKNVRIPANTNPKFSGDVTIQGVMFVESPNDVSFNGGARMEGFIVVEQKGDSTVNRIDARGSVTYGDLPLAAEFDALRAIKGISILAPTASLSIGGNVSTQLRGNVILGSFDNSGSADMRIDNGSLLTMDATAKSMVFGGKSIRFSSTGIGNQPTAGVRYGSRLLPQDGTYAERD